MFKARENEPVYAKLYDPKTEDTNRYGQHIDLLEISNVPENRSMGINGEEYVGDNPNRNKQHAFHFTADNCIGCHACEAACSEKNDLPPHLSFRSVGYVEGGTYPDYKRMNISMACNHCDDPVCLKGCPTKAYTKHAEYGAVLQDPETCFGCGYCTWVCPYNAPQLDPVKGRVEKCNMCVDRLEEELKPACVAACLGNALNFGVVENVPQKREQAKVSIPGFPDPDITHPNIRFQQIKNMPEEVTRTDAAPVKYHKGEDNQYRPVVDQKQGKSRHWNLMRLSSRENPLVIFTLSVQTALGAFVMNTLGQLFGLEPFVSLRDSAFYVPFLMACMGLMGLGLLMSTIHLGKPMRFYRGFNNLEFSPVAREALGVVVFFSCLGLHTLMALPENALLQSWLSGSIELSSFALPSVATAIACVALLAGLTGVYYMYRCYRIKARPFWNHWQTGTSFVGTMLALGSVVTGVFVLPVMWWQGLDFSVALTTLALIMAAGVALESTGLYFHAKDMNVANNEGGASHYVQSTTFGKSYWLRNILMGVNVLALVTLAIMAESHGLYLLVAGAIVLSAVCASLIGRALFYVLVIPTTMPGAFFWRNKAFEEHAREIGLAERPQVGVVPHVH